MAIVFEKQDAYVNVNPITGKVRRRQGISDFGGVSIYGVLHNNIFFPRSISQSYNILGYIIPEYQLKVGNPKVYKSIIPIQSLSYYSKVKKPNITTAVPYFIVARLNEQENKRESKFTVRNALLKISIDVLFNDLERPPINTDVDFRNVQDILVNVGGHPYGVPYINPLVIPIP